MRLGLNYPSSRDRRKLSGEIGLGRKETVLEDD